MSVALAAQRGGASPDDACEAGWAYLQIWAQRWPSPMSVISPAAGPSIRLAHPVLKAVATAS